MDYLGILYAAEQRIQELQMQLFAQEEIHQEELRNVQIQALTAMTAAQDEIQALRRQLYDVQVENTARVKQVAAAAQEETLSLRRQVYNLQMENIRVNQAAAADVNRIRDEMEMLRRDNAEYVKNLCQHYGARVGGKTQKINALHRQRARDAERNFDEVARVQQQLVAQNARHQGETAELRLEAATDVVKIRNEKEQEIADIRSEAAHQQEQLQEQHSTALRTLEEEATRLREHNQQLQQQADASTSLEEEVARLREQNNGFRRQLESQQNRQPDQIPAADEEQPIEMVGRAEFERLEQRVRELEAGQQLYNVAQRVSVNISDIHGDARQIVDEALRNGDSARTVLDFQDEN
ncbi:hypothetical protein CAEBREN_13517 [Caenorhabditis brenneri]|uniref:Uncharacterized protein n=1 Tax=Caenorhabditis brenneri TaxID=135651 RepID=G0PIQ2_CAEBE|nr:hypothetical protein CAEBREN_13517 [Caenorhabditis brenneri]